MKRVLPLLLLLPFVMAPRISLGGAQVDVTPKPVRQTVMSGSTVAFNWVIENNDPSGLSADAFTLVSGFERSVADQRPQVLAIRAVGGGCEPVGMTVECDGLAPGESARVQVLTRLSGSGIVTHSLDEEASVSTTVVERPNVRKRR